MISAVLLLECNYAMYGAKDGWVSMQPEKESIWYNRRLSLERLNDATLENELISFLQSADNLANLIDAATKEKTTIRCWTTGV